ncbi:hypothetical protein FRB99_006377 [Tulasnella sp. 403]|nr:hypothetical protein FRB99_006377 [Tulasnella sp. 403]
MQRPPIATDFARPSALPTASLRTNQQRNQQQELTSDEYLQQLEEEWNRKIDEQIEILVHNMVDLVDIAKIENKDQFRVAQEAFQAELKAESMVPTVVLAFTPTRAERDLMLLLSDEREIAERREEELQGLKKDIDEAKQTSVQLWQELTSQDGNKPSMDLS